MSFWGRVALVAAGTVLGAAATRIARPAGQDLSVRGGKEPVRTPHAGDWRSRLYRFAATVRAGMDEREAELRESFGVTAPRHSSAPLASRGPGPRVLDGTASPAGGETPTDPSTDREGKHR